MSDLSQKSVEQAVAEIWGKSKPLKGIAVEFTKQWLINAIESENQQRVNAAMIILFNVFDAYKKERMDIQEEWKSLLIDVIKNIIAGKEGAIETAKEVVEIIEGDG